MLNVARALHFQVRLLFKFWGDCVLTAIHIINKIPTPNLSNKSPYDLLFSKIPSYDHLRVFGCLCLFSTLHRNRNKFDARAKPCIFLGYPSGINGYKLYDLTSKTHVISRDVYFHESIFLFAYPHHFKSNGCIVLPHSLSDAQNPNAPTPFSTSYNFPRASISPLIPSISSPIPDSVPKSSIILFLNCIPSRKSTRHKCKLGYLQQYHCNLATQSPISIDPKSDNFVLGIPFPLNSFLDYNMLSDSYKHFSFAVSSQVEP